MAESLRGARIATESVQEALIAELDELREEIVARIDVIVPNGPQDKIPEAARDAINGEVNASLSTFERLVGQILDSGVRDLSGRGGRITTDALRAAGVPANEPFTEGIRDVFRQVAKSVTSLVALIKKRIMTGVDSAIAGAVNAITFLELLRGLLRSTPEQRRDRLRRVGPAFLLEQLADTTLMQGFSVSQQEAAVGLARQVPDLRKQWVTAGGASVRRGHAEAGERYASGGDVGPIRIGESYEVDDYSNTGPTEFATLSTAPRVVLRVPTYQRSGSVQSAEMLHPRDPGAPVGFIVGCRCVSMEVVGSFEGALEGVMGVVREEL